MTSDLTSDLWPLTSIKKEMGRISKFVFGIQVEETSFARRGFPAGEPETQRRLEKSGQAFVYGYNAALGEADLSRLAPRLNTVELELQGFAFEGAAMGLTLLDLISPWRKSRLQRFLRDPGDAHAYMVHVGAGWALARLRRRVHPLLSRLDPLLGWLVIDGYGFHEGYFHWRWYFERQMLPRRLSGYARRVFDQGLGRSLWFVRCANVNRIQGTVASFPESRRADLWSGVGLACAYAGGLDRAALEALQKAAGFYAQCLAQGAAFAAKARQRAGNPTPHTELACEVLCRMSADAAAAITDTALKRLSATLTLPEYEIWRQRIQAHFAKEPAII